MVRIPNKNKDLTTGKIWTALAKISGKKVAKKNAQIKFGSKELRDEKKAANAFNKEFAKSCIVKRTNLKRQNKRDAKKICKEEYMVSRQKLLMKH